MYDDMSNHIGSKVDANFPIFLSLVSLRFDLTCPIHSVSLLPLYQILRRN